MQTDVCVCVCTVVGIVVDCVFCLVALKSTTHNSVINTQSCTCLARIIAVQIILGVKYFSGLFECIPCTNRHTFLHAHFVHPRPVSTVGYEACQEICV